MTTWKEISLALGRTTPEYWTEFEGRDWPAYYRARAAEDEAAAEDQLGRAVALMKAEREQRD